MDIHEKYEYWLTFDDNTKNELESITDKKEIEDRFYKDLEFGTGGLRGIMGAGANRMNKYTVGKATKGLCEYLKNEFAGEKSVVIAYDSRNNSKAFAECAAEVLCYNGIKTFLFEEIMPTPVLSFSVRYLNCNAGIVITASHNPKEYNGYKVYDKYGCQLVPQYADKVISYINNVKDIKSVKHMNLNMALSNGYLTYIGDEVLNSYISEVEKRIPYIRLNGHRTKRLCTNANFSFSFIEGESLLLMLDMNGIAASSGSACTSGSLDPSHVLLAIGLPHETAHGSLRVTFGDNCTKDDVMYIVDTLEKVVSRLRDMSPLYEKFLKEGK